jgi:HopA1 effector protein family
LEAIMRKVIPGCLITALVLAHGLVAAYAPQDPASSLDALLRDVWARGVDQAYTLYMGKSEVPMDPAARQSFPRKMLGLAESPNVAVIVLQKEKSEGYDRNHLPGPEAFDGAYFVHFVRTSFDGDQVKERIYINVHPDHAAEVMAFIVRELLKPGHGVLEAKVATPSGLPVRADAIVIYAGALADIDWSLDRLSEYQTSHRDHFLKELPAATRPRLIGVSTAAQPAASLKSDSFGSYLSDTIRVAMSQQPPPADFADFRSRVHSRMIADGVDPDHPDRLTRRP